MYSTQKTFEINHHLKNIHIMVADNDPKLISLLSSVLKYIGFKNIYSASDGFQAIHLMYQHEVDLIITDWELQPVDKNYKTDLPPNPILSTERWLPVPPKNGSCFVKYLRASKYSPDPYVPVIMMTGFGLQNNVEYARDVGVNEIIVRPISVEKLCGRISTLIDNPRCFITSGSYRGPCRRRRNMHRKATERRKLDIKVIRHK